MVVLKILGINLKHHSSTVIFIFFFVGWGGAEFISKIFSFNLSTEQFDEATINSILEAVVVLLEIDVPESKAKVLMLIAELAKSGNGYKLKEAS